MVNQQHLEILERGVGAWNQWRQEHPEIIPDLESANLRKKSLDMIDFHKAIMKHVDLYRASLRGANLCDADFHMAHLYGADFSDANLSNATLKGADLVRAHLVRAVLREADLRWVKLGENDLSGADLTKSAVYGACAWDIILDDNVKQSSLDITKDRTNTIVVDNLEMAQLIHMLRNYKKMGSVINSVKKKGVLILGRFRDGGDKFLQSIATKLRDEYDYLPMIFDFERPDTLDYIETVQLLAMLSRFVIVDLSGPSVPHELHATIPHIQVPFVPIIDQRRSAHFTFSVFNKYDWVLPVFRFMNETSFMLAMRASIVEPAEKKIKELGKRYDEKIKDLGYLNILEEEGMSKLENIINIEEGDMDMWEFRTFRKIALLKARKLTEDDYQKRDGTIKTLEGVVAFAPGDYLMRGVENEEWSMTQNNFNITYERVSAFDKEGFALYRTNDIRLAYQVPEAFCVKRTNGDVLNGKAGDYLVKSGNKCWVTDRDIFERSYEAVS